MSTELTAEQARIVALVYVASLVPLGVVATQWFRGRLPRWIAAIYVATFLCCALGWELWFTYGWVDGPDGVARQAELVYNWFINDNAEYGYGMALATLGRRRMLPVKSLYSTS